jgi:SAM-dependent methyltransferase
MENRGGYEKCAHLYDLFDTEDNVGFFMHYALQVNEVVDVGAGTGRLAVAMAEAGVEVSCVEPSPAMRGELMRNLDARPELRSLISINDGDAISFSLGKVFPAVFMSRSFDHLLDSRERLGALANIWRHLETGGWLILDTGVGLMKDHPLALAGEAVAGETTYKRYVEQKVIPGQIMEVRLVFEAHRGGELVERIEETSLAGVIDRPELRRLLSETGFDIDGEFGDYTRKAYQEGDAVLAVEASKRPF